jgi:hypothetical protein
MVLGFLLRRFCCEHLLDTLYIQPRNIDSKTDGGCGLNKPPNKKANTKDNPPDLSDIPGIGPTLSERLKKAGYDSLQQISESIPAEVAEGVKGISRDKAREIAISARELLEKTSEGEKAKIAEEEPDSEIDDLAKELRSKDQQVALGAIDRLGKIEDKRATEQLMSCLEDPRYMVRMFAAVQLGEREDEKAVDALIQALHDDSLFVRQTVAGALENIGSKKGLDAIADAENEGILLNELPEGKRLN